ncbi:cold-shock protein [Bacillus sp. S10(2024)]|uniref:cold-shock protein n=1 Tax=Bacillus sp. S10(2024) TaxID=3162886 RepID=UPI003D1E2692
MLVIESVKRESSNSRSTKIIKDLLFSNNESTKVLLEKILKDTVQTNIVEQDMIERKFIPKEARNFFDINGTFLYRLSSIHYNGKVLSESVAFVDAALLHESLTEKLEARNMFIENIIQRIQARRNILYQGYQPSGNILELCNGFSLESNIFPTIKYQVVQNSKCTFYICEVFHLDNIHSAVYENL